MKTVDPVPKGHQTATAYLVVKSAADALAFYQRAFGATELFRLTDPSGKIGHAEMMIGISHVFLADEWPDFGALSPASIGGSPVSMHLYVADTDAAVERAIAAGASLLRPIENMFYGDRTGMVADPFGYKWHLASRIEEVPPQEMQKRWAQAMG
jgi:PhnB protein